MVESAGTEAAAPTFTREQVTAALNTSADTVLDAVGAGDEGTRDVVNLLVNLALTRLEDPECGLGAAVESCYEESLETVLSWCRH